MPTRGQGRYAQLGQNGKVERRLLQDANPELIGEMVLAVLSVGDAVLCGITKDGGSVRVILMSGDEKTSQYLPSAEELDAYCKSVTQHITQHLT